MTNNDILKRLRFTLNLSDDQVIKVGSLGNLEMTAADIEEWFTDEKSDQYKALQDQPFAQWLNGLIIYKRGPSDKGTPEPEKKLTNNLILRKLKIAFDMKNEDVLFMLQKSEFKLGKSELTAFFRKPGHKHYRELKDQVLRNFLNGLQKTLRPIQDGSQKAKPKGKPRLTNQEDSFAEKFQWKVPKHLK